MRGTSAAARGSTTPSAALGLLALGRGRPEEAIGPLEEATRIDAEQGWCDPAVPPHHAPDLVEALFRAGRPDAAVEILDGFEAEARRTGRAAPLAAAARCRGLLAPAEAFDEPFAAALELHADDPSPLEAGRTRLLYGERLRRAGRRIESRELLRPALAAFETLGAVPWVERAAEELRATGESVRRRDPTAVDELTPHELQVALVVAGGATNREAAARLFLSPKTIEFHLGRIFRKLGVRSRTELAQAMARERDRSGNLAAT